MLYSPPPTADKFSIIVRPEMPADSETIGSWIWDAIDYLDDEHVRHTYHQRPDWAHKIFTIEVQSQTAEPRDIQVDGQLRLDYSNTGTTKLFNSNHTLRLEPDQASTINFVGQLEQLYHRHWTPELCHDAQLGFLAVHLPEIQKQITE